ncbi:unnamed protein product [Adineta steineri]|uniref:Uncharacterized protein n=1 Tax=Adineta steineri TaxID=433720 RepID=A0A814F796_9BILA|nr:unnamed protein product [Adineta steineri]CAF1098061.1 unnamed protein product [Adineta steineri]CAF1295756.1 unnamed protein product [Adineta steineri]
MSNPLATCQHKDLWNTVHNNTFEYDYQIYATTFNYVMKQNNYQLVASSENSAKFRVNGEAVVVTYAECADSFTAELNLNRQNEVVIINKNDYLNKNKQIAHLNALVSFLNGKIRNFTV